MQKEAKRWAWFWSKHTTTCRLLNHWINIVYSVRRLYYTVVRALY
jgi:hypothetical protein